MPVPAAAFDVSVGEDPTLVPPAEHCASLGTAQRSTYYVKLPVQSSCANKVQFLVYARGKPTQGTYCPGSCSITLSAQTASDYNEQCVHYVDRSLGPRCPSR